MPMQKSPDALAREYEGAIRRIGDVINARVVLDDGGAVQEIHVLATAGREAKFIAQDVESCMVAMFGLHLDRRRISVAQIGDNPLNAGKRVLLERVEIISSALTAEVRVHLSLGGRSHEPGVATGTPTPNGWLWVAARATACAIEPYIPLEVGVGIEDVSITASRGRKVALVSLDLVYGDAQEFLTGSCPVTHDGREAVVKATLDAVNRRLEKFILST